MKFMKLLFPLWLILFLITSCQSGGNDSMSSTTEQNPQAMEAQAKKLRHVGMFQFKETSSDEGVRRVEEACAALPSATSEINGDEWGIDNSAAGLSPGWTPRLRGTVEREEERDA